MNQLPRGFDGALQTTHFSVDALLRDVGLRLASAPLIFPPTAPTVSASVLTNAEAGSPTLIAPLNFHPDDVSSCCLELNLCPANFNWLGSLHSIAYLQPSGWLRTLIITNTGGAGEETYRRRMEMVLNFVSGLSVFVLLHLWQEHFVKIETTLQQAFNDPEVQDRIIRILNIHFSRFHNINRGVSKPNFMLFPDDLASSDAKMLGVAEYKFWNKPEQTCDKRIASIREGKHGKNFQAVYADAVRDGGWKLDAVMMLAQMSSQASQTRSGMSLFTSVYGFCRIARWTNEASLPTFFITENLMPPETGQADRTDPQINYRFVKTAYIFTMKALAVAEPDLFPPGATDSFNGVLNLPSVSASYTTLVQWHLSRFVSLFESIGRWVLEKGIVFDGERLIRLCSLKFVHGIGVFRREGGSKQAWLPCIEFDLGPESNEKWVSFNLQVGLVLKTYLNADLCRKEATIYDQLDKSGFGFAPPFYGIYENDKIGMLGILIGFLGESLQCIRPCDRDAVLLLVDELHHHGFHHHDLRPNNIVRGRDGRLLLIDFESAIPKNECKSHCPDTAFLAPLRSGVAIGDIYEFHW